MGRNKAAKRKNKIGKVNQIKPKKVAKEPDNKKTTATNYFWAVRTLSKFVKNPSEVNPQNLREMLAKSPHAVGTKGGRNAILQATMLRREDILHILIESGVTIKHPSEKSLPKDGGGLNPESHQIEILSTIIDEKVYNFLTECADSPYNKLNELLRSADSAERVKALLKAGAIPNYFGSYGCTAVHEAAYCGRGVCLFTLVQHGGSSFFRSAEGRTPLHAAAIGGNKVCVEVLLKTGVNVNAGDYCSMTALHFAAGSARSAECVPILLAAGAQVNGKDKFNMTPLHYAAAYGTAETVKLLLDEGADRDALDEWHRTPGDTVYGEYDTRERKEARATIYWLLNPEGGGDELTWENIEEDYIWDEAPPLCPSNHHNYDINVLRHLACYGDVPLNEIKPLLKRSSSLVKSYAACKALQTSAEIGRLDIIRIFLKNGASPHIRESDFCADEDFEPFADPGYITSSRYDWPLIHIAAAAGQIKAIEILLHSNASKKRVRVADYPDPFGPLEAAAANGHLFVVKFLLFSGCVTDREQLGGALRLAVTPEGWRLDREDWNEEIQTRVARILLDAGADPNARDVFGRRKSSIVAVHWVTAHQTGGRASEIRTSGLEPCGEG